MTTAAALEPSAGPDSDVGAAADAWVPVADVADAAASADALPDLPRPVDDAVQDVGPDAAPDVQPDADASPEVLDDVAPDVAPDVALDAVDVAPEDVPPDTVDDIVDDVPPDIVEDIPPDIVEDIPPEVFEDIPPEVFEDVPDDVGIADDTDVGPTPFDGHTVGSFDSVEAFLAYALPDGQFAGRAKFSLTALDDPAIGEDHFMDPGFYSLHDEWYWFRLLNGVAIPGWEVEPVQGLSFASIEAVYDYYEGWEADDLPLDLVWPGDRLYSPGFYKDALDDERFFGVGTLIYLEANPQRLALPEATFLFTLEYVDTGLDEATLATFFERLEATLPPAEAASLRWLARSAGQEDAVAELIAGGGPLADRLVTYADLVLQGSATVIQRGVTAGRLRQLPVDPLPLGLVDRHDILVLDTLPAVLPPVAGVILTGPSAGLTDTASIAHSRRFPIIHIPGALEDPGISDWLYFKSWVALRARESGTWEPWSMAPLGGEEQGLWKLATTPVPIDAPPVARDSAPWVIDLSSTSDTELLAPVVGREAAGVAHLLATGGAAAPEAALGVTSRGWAEHGSPTDAVVDALQDDTDYNKDERVRFLVLEGADAFEAAHLEQPSTVAWMNWFIGNNGPQTLLGSVIAGGGLRQIIADLPADAAGQAAIADAVDAAFAPDTALTLRPSSTVDHLRGLHGAGLYDTAAATAGGDDLDAALRAVWSSWWTYPAAEARRAAGIPDDGGGMGIVITAAPGSPDVVLRARVRATTSGAVFMTVNAQAAPGSVATPALDEQLEVVEVKRYQPQSDLLITRTQGSSMVADGVWLLSDPDLEALLSATEDVVAPWRDALNDELPEPQRWRSLEVGFDARQIDGALRLDGARRWEPRLDLPPDVVDAAVPRDVLPQVDEARLTSCDTGPVLAQTLDLWTQETWCPPAGDFGQNSCPQPFFNGAVAVLFKSDVPELGVDAGAWAELDHTEALIAHPFMHHGGYDLYLEVDDATVGVPFDVLDVLNGGYWSMSVYGGGSVSGGQPSCSFSDVYEAPGQWLLWLLSP